MKKMDNLVGKIYEDPTGEFEVLEINGNQVTVKNVQEGNADFGHEYIVDIEEVKYFINS